jgi:outer membrane murein-binding lipoprotein Lpp
MKQLSRLILCGAASLVLAAGQAALAAPGGGGGGMGGGMGNGGIGGGMGGGMGNAGGMGRGMSGSGFEAPRPTISSHSSTTTLNNQHLTTSLTNALGRSGITLPTGGLQAACGGFHNLGQCVAALHVAQNLNLPGGFTALKGLTTGPNAQSLGSAIQQLSPQTDARTAEKTAKRQANRDLDRADELAAD